MPLGTFEVLSPSSMTGGQIWMAAVYNRDGGTKFAAVEIKTIDKKAAVASVDVYAFKVYPGPSTTDTLSLDNHEWVGNKNGPADSSRNFYTFREPTPTEMDKIIDIMAASLDAAEARSQGGNPDRPPAAPKVTVGMCLCGCPDKPKGGLFMPGHDAKVKGMVKKAMRGEIKASQIPSPFRGHFRLVKFCTGNPEMLAFMEKVVK